MPPVKQEIIHKPLRFCFECGDVASCDHHVVPISMGGKKTVPLCLKCHGKIHGKNFLLAKKLQRLGIERAKSRGLYKGRSQGTTKQEPMRAYVLRRDTKMTIKEISHVLGVSRTTTFKYLRLAKRAEKLFLDGYTSDQIAKTLDIRGFSTDIFLQVAEGLVVG